MYVKGGSIIMYSQLKNAFNSLYNIKALDDKAYYKKFYNKDSITLEVFKLVAYLSDDDFNKFIRLIKEIEDTIRQYYTNYTINGVSDMNKYYKWLVPEYIRIYNAQWIYVYSSWRTMVREHFILGKPNNTNIHLLEARDERYRFAPVFKDIIKAANIRYPFGTESAMDKRLTVPFHTISIPMPSEEPSMTLKEFLTILVGR